MTRSPVVQGIKSNFRVLNALKRECPKCVDRYPDAFRREHLYNRDFLALAVGSPRDTSQKYSARAGPGGGWNWNDQVFSLWIQQTECKEHCGNGLVRPACDFGLQYEEINEGVVGTAVSSGNELIRFTRPMRRMSRGDEKRDGIAGQKLTMLRKIAYFFSNERRTRTS